MRILSDKIVYPGPFVTSSHIKLIFIVLLSGLFIAPAFSKKKDKHV